MTPDDERPSTVPVTGAPPDDRRAGGPPPGGAQVGARQEPPADEAERQAQETVRSISRLEESN